jgi:DNA-binding SARP family transcriptional activator
MAGVGDRGAVRVALGAERRAVAAGTDLARFRALAALDAAGAADHGQRVLVAELARTGGLADPLAGPAAVTPSHVLSDPAPAIVVCCFGGLRVSRDGQPLDLASIKPRARSLLRLLAVHPGRALHRDAIVEALWPEHDPAAGTRSLQVAVSSLRQLLEPGVGRGCSAFIVRQGDGYLLAMPPGSTSDVAMFTDAMGVGRDHLRRGHAQEAADAFRQAIDVYTGELVPEEGAAEWVVKQRHRMQMDAADAAGALGEGAAALGDIAGAIYWFEHCLAIDAYRDGVWRRLVELAQQGGDRATASEARRRYRAMLKDLDLPGSDLSG